MPHQCHTNGIRLNTRKLSAELRGAINREISWITGRQASSKSDLRFAVTTARTSAIAVVNQTVAARPSASVQFGESFLKTIEVRRKSGVSVHA